MKRAIISNILIFTLFHANATINNIYQTNMFNLNDTKTQLISNDSISLNPAIDEINPSDPRIKTLIDYAHANSYGVSIIFFNKENLRYVKQLKELFITNNIYTDPPELTKIKNLVDFNLIKIYIIKEKHNANN